MPAAFKVLNDLSYVLECLSQDLTGEAKHELSMLCDSLDANPEYFVYGKEQITETLREARTLLLDGHDIDCAVRLCKISRLLWSAVDSA